MAHPPNAAFILPEQASPLWRTAFRLALVPLLSYDAWRSLAWVNWEAPVNLTVLGHGFDALIDGAVFSVLPLLALLGLFVWRLRVALMLYAVLSLAAGGGAIGSGLGLQLADMRDADLVFDYGVWRWGMALVATAWLIASRRRAPLPI